MNDENTAPVVDESPEYRAELMTRATMLGLTIHPQSKNATIAAKIAAALADKPADAGTDADTADLNKADRMPSGSSFDSADDVALSGKKAKEVHPAKKLHRVIITCNDPQKADQSGDVISVSNGEVGNLRFYFHFNKPWHVPEIVLETLKESKLFLHSSRKDGREVVTREVPRYNIQVLPALTDKERGRIADKQAAALATED